jgi:hypothetical protein
MVAVKYFARVVLGSAGHRTVLLYDPNDAQILTDSLGSYYLCGRPNPDRVKDSYQIPIF